MEPLYEPTIGYRIHGKSAHIICTHCDKIIFPTEKDAKHELRRIRELKQKNEKKPVRVYECKKSNGWHLTSKPHHKFKDECDE